MSRPEFILTLEGVDKTFDGFKAINDLNFYMDAGELRTIIGPNGAGKSTLLDLITGRTRPDTGIIEFGKETDLTKLNEYQINRLGIGRKFQTPSVYTHHTVFENIWLSLEGSLADKHSIIVIEHDMVFVRQIARKITVLHQGTVLCEGSVDEVQNDERVIEVYLGKKRDRVVKE